MYRVLFTSFALVAFVLAYSSSPVFTKGKVVDKTNAPDKGKEVTPTPPKTQGPTIIKDDAVPGDVEIVFLNGSKVRMTIHTEKLEIITIYGKLTVPVEDVQSIEFGLHYPEGMLEKVEQAVKNLGSTDYRERDKATKALIDMGRYAYPAVVAAGRSRAPLEVTKRAKEIVQKLQEKLPKKDQRASADDKVVTPTHTIVGRIVTPTVKTKADYFGEIDHKIANMRSLRAIGSPGIELDILVDAGKFGGQAATDWMDTGYQVDNRYGLVIAAKGMIDTWPQQPGGYMAGPDGTRRFPAAIPGVNGQKVMGQITGQTYGSVLIGRIGESGEAFVIGSRYDGKPEAEGKLYLLIGPSQWQCPSTGNFEVKISRRGD